MSDERDDASAVGSIPVTFKSGNNTIQGKRALVVAPNAGEIGAYGNVRAQTCATCVKFHHREGQAAMDKQRFLERIVLEETWKVKHIGAPPTSFGLCGETNGDTITSIFTPACEHWRQNNGRLGRR